MNENVEWHQKQVHKAKTLDELNQAAWDIDYDAWEKMDWTKDKRQLARLSMLVDAKRNEINGLSMERGTLEATGRRPEQADGS